MYFDHERWEAPTETKIEPWQQLLLDAADYIDVHGWCQGDYSNAAGNVCAVGAICAVNCGRPSTGVGFSEAMSATSRHVGCYLPKWNDESGRTQAQVTAAMRAAARAV